MQYRHFSDVFFTLGRQGFSYEGPSLCTGLWKTFPQPYHYGARKNSRSLHIAKTYFDTNLLPTRQPYEAGTDTEPLRFNEHTETAARDPRSLRFSGKKQDGKQFFSNKRKKSNRTSQKPPPLSQRKVVPGRNIPEPPSKTFLARGTTFWQVPLRPSGKCR